MINHVTRNMLIKHLSEGPFGMPYYHISEDKPYILSWFAITCFCLWSSVMFISISVTYGKYRELYRYSFNNKSIQGVFAQNSTELFSIFVFIFFLVLLFLIAFHLFELGNYWLASFLFYYFILAFIVICYIEKKFIFHLLVSEFMLLPIQQGLVMTVFLTFSGRAINPSSNPEETEFESFESIQYHFENWWKLARLGMTGIISISIGVAITITISDSSTLSVSTLLANVFLSSIPFTLFVVIIVQKIYWFNEEARDNFR